jgi:PKHD-type hydroxylase
MLLKIENVLDADELLQVNTLLAQAEWVDGRVTAGKQAAIVKNNQQLSEQNPEMQALRKIVLNALSRNPVFFSSVLPLKILPPFFNRYRGNSNFYGAHVDNAMRMLPDGSDYVRADISATLFLSDPDTYEGGELIIEDTFGSQGVKLKAGSIVIYPSSSVHQVSPVTKGERVACFMFIQSMVRDPVKRRLLYDMDMALIDLRSKVGEDDAVVKLTGAYHNLLRLWTE